MMYVVWDYASQVLSCSQQEKSFYFNSQPVKRKSWRVPAARELTLDVNWTVDSFTLHLFKCPGFLCKSLNINLYIQIVACMQFTY